MNKAAGYAALKRVFNNKFAGIKRKQKKYLFRVLYIAINFCGKTSGFYYIATENNYFLITTLVPIGA